MFGFSRRIPTYLIDLMESQPSLGNGLKALLDFEGDVEELDMCFQINENRFGRVVTVDLIENAENVAVNNQNKQLYVRFPTSNRVFPFPRSLLVLLLCSECGIFIIFRTICARSGASQCLGLSHIRP